MKFLRPDRKWPWLALLAAVGAAGPTAAQQRYRTVEEPRWLKFRLKEISTGVYAEGTYEDVSYRNSDTTVRHDRLFIGPSLGLQGDGSVYHPNLLRYHLNLEGAVGWAHDSVESATSSRDRDELQFLGRALGSADLLGNKPYNANVFGNYDYTFRDYDFFSRATVKSWRYGGRTAYSTESLFLSAHYTHRDEDVSGLSVDTESHEDVMGLDARHERKSGSSHLGYTHNRYSRVDQGRAGEGKDHLVILSDQERFGDRNQFRFNANLTYNHRDAGDESGDQVTAGANLLADHRDNLSSYYDFLYDHYTTDSFESDNYLGRAELRHQLYESLGSTLFVQAANYEVSDLTSSGYTRRYGGGFAETYTKRLGAAHRLRLNNTLLVEHVDRSNIGAVENERHSFAEALGGAPPDSFFLNLPNVIEITIEVTDANDSQPPFVLGLDYGVLRNGNRTLIQRLPGSRIPAGGIVLVDYRAEPTPAGSYEALTEVFQIRFDLFENLWGIYGRFNLSVNNAPDELRVQELASYTAGTDVNWRWLRAGAEYEIYDSDQSAYHSARLFQSFSFRPDEASSLSAGFTETWTDFQDADRQEEDYRFILRYQRALTERWRASLDGGFALRRGRGVDQTLATARPGFEYVIGKTSVKAGYDYEYQLFLNNEERQKHMFFLRARRVF